VYWCSRSGGGQMQQMLGVSGNSSKQFTISVITDTGESCFYLPIEGR